MKRLPKVRRVDWKFVPVDPDPGFDPEHNRKTIEDSIKKYEAMRAKKMKEHTNGVEERTSALAMFLKSSERGASESDLKKYFGPTWLAHMQGKLSRARLNDQLRVLDADGRVIREAGNAQTKA